MRGSNHDRPVLHSIQHALSLTHPSPHVCSQTTTSGTPRPYPTACSVQGSHVPACVRSYDLSKGCATSRRLPTPLTCPLTPFACFAACAPAARSARPWLTRLCAPPRPCLHTAVQLAVSHQNSLLCAQDVLHRAGPFCARQRRRPKHLPSRRSPPCPWQKEGLGMDRAIEECKYRMSRYSVTPNVSLTLKPHTLPIRQLIAGLAVRRCSSCPRRQAASVLPFARNTLLTLSVCPAAAPAVPRACARGEDPVHRGRRARRHQVRRGRRGLREPRLPRPRRLPVHALRVRRSPPTSPPPVAHLLTCSPAHLLTCSPAGCPTTPTRCRCSSGRRRSASTTA